LVQKFGSLAFKLQKKSANSNIPIHEVWQCLDEYLTYSLQEKKTPWSESASVLYRPRDRHLSAKLVPTFAERGCHMVSVTDPYGRILCFLDRSRYFFFQVAPQLCSRGWVDPVPDPLLLRKSGSAGNRTRVSGCSQELWPLDHRGGPLRENNCWKSQTGRIRMTSHVREHSSAQHNQNNNKERN
jgi:hypothetical protein